MIKLNEKKINLLLYIYIIALPILDIMKFLFGNGFQVFGISIVEILNILFCFTFVVLAIIYKFKNKKNISYWSIIFLLLFFIYMIFHVFNTLQFNVDIVGKISNPFVEVYYIFRSYFLPFCLLYSFMNLKMDKNNVIKNLSLLSFIISFIIVISNLLEIGYVSYDSYLDGKTVISGSIFDWISKVATNNCDLFTSKGFFYSTNQISLVLIALLVISSLYLQENKKWYMYISFIIKILAMIMISTKTCFLGILITIVFNIFINILFLILKKEKFDLKFNVFLLLCFIGSISLFYISPISYKLGYNERYIDNNLIHEILPEKLPVIDGDYHSSNIQNYIYNMNVLESKEYRNLYANLDEYEIFEIIKKKSLSTDEKEIMISVLDKCNSFFGIHGSYKILFPIEDNFEFWFNSVKLGHSVVNDFRGFKFRIFDHVISLNNNITGDKLFGIGYTSNFPYTETDIIGQYTWFGIFGVILFVLPFYVLFLYNLILFLINIKNNFNKLNIYLLFSELLILLVCLVTGHCFGNIFPMSILIILSCLNNQILKEQKINVTSNNKKKILFIIWSFTYGGGAEKILANLVNNMDLEKYEIDIIEYWHSDKKINNINESITLLKPIVDSTKASKIEKLIKKILVYNFPSILRKFYIKKKYDYEISFNYMIPTFLLDKNAKSFAWLHGDIYELQDNKYEYRIQKKSLNYVDRIITISQNTYNSVIDLYPEYKDKTRIIYNSYEFEQIEHMSNSIKLSTNKYPTLLFLGRLDDNKNPMYMLEVAKVLKEKKYKFILNIIGHGSLFDLLTEKIKEYKLENYVKLLGFKENPYPYIKNCDILCLTSHSEGFPTVLIESLILKKTFVSTNVGGALEISNNNKCGFVVDSQEQFIEKLEVLIKNKKIYDDMCMNSDTFVKKFSSDTQIASLEKEFMEVENED
ncbi:MAG: glycosyltransferase [Firmicutes bacterium]|nr:glycosyltransferase [Bacillota bacterium]